MKTFRRAGAGLGLVSVLFFACSKEQPQANRLLQLEFPAYFPEAHYSFEGNEVTWKRFELGRQLFYDKQLSTDNSISCGTCHAQVHGFADHGLPLSHGVNGRTGTRNAPPIFNVAWNTSFMWDGGINHIEVMPIGPITSEVEMNQSIAATLGKLNGNLSYRQKFKEAYGLDSITDQAMLRALSQFMAMIVSTDSKYDQFRKGEAVFTPLEEHGYQLFKQHCDRCHSEPLFTNFGFYNNGLDSVFPDPGRGRITLKAEDQGKFKVPSLRNVAVTYPYMHNGRVTDLNHVIDHYISGIVSSPTLDPGLANGIPLNQQERHDLLLFLNTLTDYTFLSNPLYQEQP
jgi:cytochrome c peroxidase